MVSCKFITKQHSFFYLISVNISVSSDKIVIAVPGKFHHEWLESKYANLIRSAVYESTGHNLAVEYIYEDDSSESAHEPPQFSPKVRTLEKGYHDQTQLNSRYTFDNFIEGKSNQLAKAAAISVAENPGQTPFNPLLIYSGTGLGKTHLLQAIGNDTTLNKVNIGPVICNSIYRRY